LPVHNSEPKGSPGPVREGNPSGLEPFGEFPALADEELLEVFPVSPTEAETGALDDRRTESDCVIYIVKREPLGHESPGRNLDARSAAIV